MTDDRIAKLHDYPFRRLNKLLGETTSNKSPIALQIGEPQNAAPALLGATVAEHGELWSKYPPLKGSADYRRAVADWATRRYGLPAGAVDPETNVLIACGSREALYQAACLATERKKQRLGDGVQPAICLPNPLYHVYYGGALMAGAEPVTVDATPENNFIPDYDGLPEELLDRTALVFLCTPGNPTGTVASRAQLERMIKAARKHDFILAVDECYSEIWFGEPSIGGLEAAHGIDGTFDNLLVFNSLSKRSSAPGIRCGFIAGDAGLLDDFAMLRAYGGAQIPGPLQAAGAALWDDETHVAENRALYDRLVGVAEEELGGLPGYQRPEAAFFLWLDTAKSGLSGEEAAKRLWQEQAVKVMAGRFMSRAGDDGASPGDDFIRIALVFDEEITREACRRIRQVLDNGGQ